MAAWLDGCRFTPTLGGTTDFTFSVAVTGYNSPGLAGVVNARVYKWRAESADLSQWEVFEGAYNTGTGVAARTTVLYNSSGTGTATGQSGAGTKISFSTVPTVACIGIKEDLISIEEANSFTTTQQAQARTNIAAAPTITTAVNALGADTAISNAAYTDGPSMAQGTAGTWFVSGTVTFLDTSGATQIKFKLWDGTTVIDSGSIATPAANFTDTITLSGVITSPAANIRISAQSTAAGATSTFKFNASGNSMDCKITGIRIA